MTINFNRSKITVSASPCVFPLRSQCLLFSQSQLSIQIRCTLKKEGSHQQCAGHLYSQQDPVKDPVNKPGGCQSSFTYWSGGASTRHVGFWSVLICTITLGTGSAGNGLPHVLNQLPEVVIVCYQEGGFNKEIYLVNQCADKSRHPHINEFTLTY